MTQKKGISIETVENRKALLIRLVLAGGFVYIFASLAVDSGSYWHYLFTFVSFGIAVNAIGRITKDIIRRHGKHSKK